MSVGMSGPEAFRTRRPRRAGVVLAGVLTGALLCVSPTVAGQAAGVNQAGPEYLHGQAGMQPMPQNGNAQGGSQIEQMRRAERQRRVAADTAKLVQLSNELKAAVDQTPKDQLSLDAMKKATEIEKTAHDLKAWMATN